MHFRCVRDFLVHARTSLRATSNTPALDADLICSMVTGLPRSKLIAYPETLLNEKQCELLNDLLARRMKHVPLAHLSGLREFWGLEFHVSEKVLVPRPETEHLVEEALLALHEIHSRPVIADLGTGSACIPVALATELKSKGVDPVIFAVDRSAAALEVARMNIERHQLEGIIHLVHGDWFGPFPREGVFDLVVSNPPYISASDTRLSPELVYEPPAALYSDDEGLADIKKIVESAPDYLKSDGLLMLEIGSEQGDAVRSVAAARGLNVSIKKDLAGHDRVAALRR